MNKFQQDLQFSRVFEIELIKHLEDVDRFEQVLDHIAFYDYDIKIFKNNGNIETYEVKCDRIAYKTGNIAIEYFNRGKKSGIQTSKATYYAIFCIDDLNSYELYIIPRKKLIKMINKQEFFMNKKTFDDSHFVLFKKQQIKDNCILYKSIY